MRACLRAADSAGMRMPISTAITVNASAVRVENCVQFGGPWLALQLIKKIGLDVFFQQHMPSSRAEIRWSSMALVFTSPMGR